MMSTLGPFESQVEWGILRGHSRRRHVEWDVEWGKSNALSTCKSNGAVGVTRSGPPGGADVLPPTYQRACVIWMSQPLQWMQTLH